VLIRRFVGPSLILLKTVELRSYITILVLEHTTIRMPPQHVCGEECLIVNRDSTIVCRITGHCQQQFISRCDFKVDRSKLFTAFDQTSTNYSKNKCTVTPPDVNVVKEITKLLLFSNKRSKITSASTSNDGNQINNHPHHRKRRKILKLEPDDQILKDICESVRAVTKKIEETASSLLNKNSHRALIVATLYLMQHGKTYTSKSGTRTVIPQIQYLYCNLPPISVLEHFGIAKNIVRIGSNLIQKIARNI